MFNVKTVEIDLGGKTLKLETGRVARQADGAVMAQPRPVQLRDPVVQRGYEPGGDSHTAADPVPGLRRLLKSGQRLEASGRCVLVALVSRWQAGWL